MTHLKATLVDRLYAQIKEDIVLCTLQPGQKLNFHELAEHYQASETPLKQALNRLVAEDLVESVPRKGMWIKRMTEQDIQEMLDIRVMIELHSLDKVIVALNNNTALQARIRENIDKHYQYGRSFSDILEYFETYRIDQQFHELLVTCTGNRKLVSLYQNLGTHNYAYHIYGRQPREKVISGVREHEELFQALLDGDRTRAEEEIRRHNDNARQIITLMLRLDRI